MIAELSGRYAESEAYFARALAIGESELRPQHWLLGMVLRDLGGLYGLTGRFTEARVLRRAIENLNKSIGPQYRTTLVAMSRLAHTYLDAGRAQEAEPVLRETLTASERSLGAQHGDNAHLLRMLGRSLQQQGRFAEAEPMYKRAIAVAEGLPRTGGRTAGPILGLLGSLYIDQRRFAEAKDALDQAQSRAQAALGEDHPTTLSILANMARLDRETDQPEEALAKLKRVVSALAPRAQGSGRLASERYRNDMDPSFRRRVAAGLAAVAWQLDGGQGEDRARANDALAAAQLVMDSTAASAIGQMATRFAAADDALGLLVREGQDLLHRWQALNQQLVADVAENSMDPDRREDMRVELDRIAKDLGQVDRRLAAEFPQYAELARPTALGIGQVQKLLRPDEGLVTFLIGKRESFVWAIGQEEFAWRRIPIGEAELAEKVARLRKGLDIADLQAKAKAGTAVLFDLALAHDLYRELLGPVERILAGKRNLLIVPAGALTSLPFHLLVTEPPAAPITDLTQVPQYRDARWIIQSHAITMLPSVASLAKPTEADDGLLTASEVARLKLNADWVVLSACNTAAGDKAGAEAFSGLARAFFYAGARAILVSHWPVDSAAAVALTTKAFEALQQQPGMGRAEALRQSMLAYMNDPSDPLNAHPALWAPFVIVGEGGR